MKPSTVTIAASLAGVLALGSPAFPPESAEAQTRRGKIPNFTSKVKCYGVSKAGENDCAHINGSHSCAGQSTIDYDSGEWKIVNFGECLNLKGSPNQAFRVRLASGRWGYDTNPNYK